MATKSYKLLNKSNKKSQTSEKNVIKSDKLVQKRPQTC